MSITKFFFSFKVHILSKNPVELDLIKASTNSIQRRLNTDCDKVYVNDIDLKRMEKVFTVSIEDGILALKNFNCDIRSFLA